MPPLPPVANVVKIITSGTYHDAKWLNIFYVQYDSGIPTAATLASYLAVWAAAVDTAWGAEMSADNEVTGHEAIDLSSDTGATASVVDSTFGVRAGDFMPAGVALVMSHEISRRYRGGHPRSYLPWGTAGTMASGSTKDWDPAFLADCQTKFDTFASAISGHLILPTHFDSLVNVSYTSGGARRVTPVVDGITSHIARPRISSQRRRLGRVGG